MIGKYYPPFCGGIEFVSKNLAEHLAKTSDVDVIVSAHDEGSGSETINGVFVRRLWTPLTLFSQPISPGMFGALRLDGYDVILLHAPNPYAAVVLAARLAFQRHRGELAIVHHMDIQGRRLLRRLHAPFYRGLVRQAKWVAVTSTKNFEVSEDLGPDAPVVTLPVSIDPADYRISSRDRLAASNWRRARYGDAPLVGFVGRHARYKGLDVLVRAIARLEGVQAVVAGTGAYTDSAKALARKLGVDDRIDFIGEVSDGGKLRLFASIDVFAFPSTEKTEAFGVTLLEAMVIGSPVVASNLPTGVTDVAVADKTALLCTPGDEVSLARQIERLLGDKRLCDRLRSNARKHVLSRFTDQVVMTQLDDLISRALATPSHNRQRKAGSHGQ